MKTLFTALLEKALRKYLQMDPDTLNHLGKLSGKVIKVTFTELDSSLFLLPDANGIRVRAVFDGLPDAEIKGSVFVLLYASTSEDAAELRNRIELSGDIELAQKFSQILQQRHVDWEEPLSKFIGDIGAHKVGNFVRGIKQWGQHAKDRLQENLSNYLTEELGMFPPREELEDFFYDIYELRNDVERFQAKLDLLRMNSNKDATSE